MSTSTTVTTASTGDDEWEDALRAATAFIAGFRSPDTRKGYRRDLRCWSSAPPMTFIPTSVFVVRMSRCTCASSSSRSRRWRLDAAAADLHNCRRGSPDSRTRRSTPATPPLGSAGRGATHGRSRGWTAMSSLICWLPPSRGWLRLRADLPAWPQRAAGLRGVQPRRRRSRRRPLPADVADRRQGRQARRDPAEPAHARGHRSGAGRTDRRAIAAQPVGQSHATPQCRRHRHPARQNHRDHPASHSDALRRSYITIGLLQGVPLREMRRAARHTRADTTVGYDQSDRSFHRDPTFVLMTATAR
jgi:hypothetical protein